MRSPCTRQQRRVAAHLRVRVPTATDIMGMSYTSTAACSRRSGTPLAARSVPTAHCTCGPAGPGPPSLMPRHSAAAAPAPRDAGGGLQERREERAADTTCRRGSGAGPRRRERASMMTPGLKT